MFHAFRNVFISDLETVRSNKMALEINKITDIVSVGCFCPSPTAELYRNISFPDIKDSPESKILHIFRYIKDFFPEDLVQENNARKILIHCVYGQSRSATVVVLYMLSVGYSLTNALDSLKVAHPSICINPGFLSQLHLFCEKKNFFAEYKLVCFALNCVLQESVSCENDAGPFDSYRYSVENQKSSNKRTLSEVDISASYLQTTSTSNDSVSERYGTDISNGYSAIGVCDVENVDFPDEETSISQPKCIFETQELKQEEKENQQEGGNIQCMSCKTFVLRGILRYETFIYHVVIKS